MTTSFFGDLPDQVGLTRVVGVAEIDDVNPWPPGRR
jgi:hypothetical protein